jgi:hypothetical protein
MEKEYEKKIYKQPEERKGAISEPMYKFFQK